VTDLNIKPSRNNSISKMNYFGNLIGKINRRFMHYYRKWFCQQNFIFRHEGPFNSDDRTDCTFKRFDSYDNLPEEVRAEIRADGITDRLEYDRRELEENSTLWIAFCENHVTATVFTRKGKYFRRWFLDLNDDDVVVFRLRTHPDYRGRGLAPSLIRNAIHEVVENNGSAFIDCRTYNKPSIRCIEKAGFKCVAKKKTISREWALYE